MYWFLAGFLAGLVINFLARKVIDSDSINLLWEALKPAKLRFAKRHPADPLDASGQEEPSERVKAIGVQS